MSTTPTVPADAPEATARRSHPARTAFLVTTAISFLLGAVWAISTPLFASPDEPSHATRAVATWTGDPSGTISYIKGIRIKDYRVPSPYDEAQPIAVCSAFHPDRAADCGPAFRPDGHTVTASSTAGFYPPLFYWVVGWGGAIDDGSGGMYLMRLIHVAVCAVLIGLAAASTVRRGGRGLALAGLALAVTPMVVFLAGTVNASGMEIAASIALWASLLALLEVPARGATARWPDAATAMASGLVLVFTRTFSPGYAAVICAVALVASPSVGPRSIWRRRDALVTFGVLAVGSVAATLMIIASGQFDSPATSGASLGPGQTPLSYGLGYQEVGFRQMVAVFGWLDTGTAQLSYYCWVLGVGAVVVAALLVGRWRRSLGIGLALAATVVLPIAANWGQAETDGFVWQGRYSLPFAVGLPIIAAIACEEGRPAAWLRRRFVILLAVLAAVGQVYAVYWALRRFAVGLDGPLVFFGSPDWAPPVIGAGGTMVAATVAAVAMAVALVRADGPRTTDEPGDASPADGLPADADADADPPPPATNPEVQLT